MFMFAGNLSSAERNSDRTLILVDCTKRYTCCYMFYHYFYVQFVSSVTHYSTNAWLQSALTLPLSINNVTFYKRRWVDCFLFERNLTSWQKGKWILTHGSMHKFCARKEGPGGKVGAWLGYSYWYTWHPHERIWRDTVINLAMRGLALY